MKKKAGLIVLAVLLVLSGYLVLTIFQAPLLADSAACDSGRCKCSCSGSGCNCVAEAGSCSCICSQGGGSTCGKTVSNDPKT